MFFIKVSLMGKEKIHSDNRHKIGSMSMSLQLKIVPRFCFVSEKEMEAGAILQDIVCSVNIYEQF